MAKCFIHGHSLKDLNGKQACLKIYRDKDSQELSINFDNSLGAFRDECRRIQACVFSSADAYDHEPKATMYITDSKDLANIIHDFVNGFDF